jgi:hypothetical protein
MCPLKKGDIDCILLGKSGMYAFEIKNHSGVIVYYDKGKWLLIKVGGHGKLYKGNFRDPSTQLVRNLSALKRYLGENGFRTWIKGAVVFTNPDSRLVMKSKARVGATKLDDLSSLIANVDALSKDEQGRAEVLILVLPHAGEEKGRAHEAADNTPVLEKLAGNTS